MHQVSLRTVLPVLLTLVGLVVAVTGATLMIRADRSRQAAADLLGIAQNVQLPTGSMPFSGVSEGCPTSQNIRCGRINQDVDSVAEQMQATLSVIAEEEAKVTCGTLPSRQPGVLRDCIVRIDRSGHALLISINPIAHRVDGIVVLGGAEVRIQVS